MGGRVHWERAGGGHLGVQAVRDRPEGGQDRCRGGRLAGRLVRWLAEALDKGLT